MKIFSFSIPTTVQFDVEAESLDEAVLLADKIVRESDLYTEGSEIHTLYSELHPALHYINGPWEFTVLGSSPSYTQPDCSFEKIKRYSPELCRQRPDCVFVFGDNLIGVGGAGQAVIRKEPNAHGLPTKKLPYMSPNAFFTDSEIELNKKYIIDALDSIPECKTVVFPEDGLGTGLAKLPEKAPKTYAFMVEEINRRFGDVYEN